MRGGEVPLETGGEVTHRLDGGGPRERDAHEIQRALAVPREQFDHAHRHHHHGDGDDDVEGEERQSRHDIRDHRVIVHGAERAVVSPGKVLAEIAGGGVHRLVEVLNRRGNPRHLVRGAQTRAPEDGQVSNHALGKPRGSLRRRRGRGRRLRGGRGEGLRGGGPVGRGRDADAARAAASSGVVGRDRLARRDVRHHALGEGLVVHLGEGGDGEVSVRELGSAGAPSSSFFGMRAGKGGFARRDARGFARDVGRHAPRRGPRTP